MLNRRDETTRMCNDGYRNVYELLYYEQEHYTGRATRQLVRPKQPEHDREWTTRFTTGCMQCASHCFIMLRNRKMMEPPVVFLVAMRHHKQSIKRIRLILIKSIYIELMHEIDL